ncbi:CHAT domain-containing protein [Dactylosporangium sp. CA-139066]|uniref:CHAT domain-containing protein n=1 Tax=Dactylosporangium sp. CA-139066 TaxID=3239930 RepID=UPI003D94D0CF
MTSDDPAWGGPSREIDRRMALAREWDELVEEVRRLPGFEDFLRPPSLETLLPAAADGPVVIVNVSRWRCDALIVTREGVELVPLPHLSLDEVVERVGFYLRTVGHFEDAGKGRDGNSRDAVARELRGLETDLGDVLAWCWDSIAAPVLERLGLTEAPADGAPWPKLWWCPTGPLTLLPLHAAGRHGTDGAAVMDRVISSYTPTLRALLEARRPRPDAEVTAGDALLVVALPDTPGQPSLPNVRREVEMLSRLGTPVVLEGSAATVAGVGAALPSHRWVHFSCHGQQHLDDPSRGGLLLYDGMLTVNDISSRQYRGDLAFLSACKTATGGLNLPDEAITLAAALHYTGYRHVIATLWSVWDDSAADVTETVYRHIRDGAALRPERSAHALHEAVRELRRRDPDRPSVWTPFTHTGP